jgi:hypothetical protein
VAVEEVEESLLDEVESDGYEGGGARGGGLEVGLASVVRTVDLVECCVEELPAVVSSGDDLAISESQVTYCTREWRETLSLGEGA